MSIPEVDEYHRIVHISDDVAFGYNHRRAADKAIEALEHLVTALESALEDAEDSLVEAQESSNRMRDEIERYDPDHWMNE